MMTKNIFIVGVAGLQGYPAAKALLKQGFNVRGLVTRATAKSEELKQLGVEIVEGNLFDLEGLTKLMQGMDSLLFIPVIPTAGSPITEYTVGYNVITAAERAGIQYMIHTSVDRAGDHHNFSNWGINFDESMRYYWLAKAAVIELVKASKTPHWTIIKPAYLMECFLPPKVNALHPLLKEGIIVTAHHKQTKLPMTNADDQADLIVKAFTHFEPFDHQEFDLVSERLAMSEIAQTLSEVLNKNVIAQSKTKEELCADTKLAAALMDFYKAYEGIDSEKLLSATVGAHEWDNTDGYAGKPETIAQFGVGRSFKEWAKQHRDEFEIA